MSKILSEMLASDRSYATSFGDRSKLALPPARHFAILTCMDARLDPAKYAGLAQTHFGLATLYRKQGKTAEATEHMREFQRLQRSTGAPEHQ